MAKEHVLEIVIDEETGVTTIDSVGFVGKECEEIAAWLSRIRVHGSTFKVHSSAFGKPVFTFP